MHNFIKAVKSVEDNLNLVGKGLHSPKKEFFALEKTTLLALYKDYDILAGKDELHLLTKQWPFVSSDVWTVKKEKEKKRHLANQLYGDDRPFVNDHWENLTKNNGGETLYCPICGLQECDEMDHFVPRDENQFPEYSAHLSNLIPLCHNCNHKKSTSFLGTSGERLFFNAFYDTLTKRDIIICYITESPIDGMPQIEAKCNLTLSAYKSPDKYIISTIKELGLMIRFNDKAKKWLRHEMNRLSYRSGQDWNAIKTEMASLSIPAVNEPDIVHAAVMGSIATSAVMEKWFKAL